MLKTITIRKGLDLPITGAAETRLTDARNIMTYAVKPTDFVGLTPRLLVEEGDAVDVGDALFCDKKDERIRFTTPVSGHVKAIVRGEKRKVLEVVVTADGETKPLVFNIPTSAEDIKNCMLKCGLWPMLRQRPFGTVATPDDKPKAIFVSAFSSAPLAPDYDFVMQGREEYLKKGLEALTQFTDGKVYISFRPGQKLASQLSTLNCQLSTVNLRYCVDYYTLDSSEQYRLVCRPKYRLRPFEDRPSLYRGALLYPHGQSLGGNHV